MAISTICWSAMDRPRAGRSGSRSTPSRANSSAVAGVHGLAVDAAEAAAGLAAHEDVLGDRQVGEERRLLVDDGDAGVAGVGRAVEDDRLAVEQHLAGVRPVHAGEGLDQGRLARAVLAGERVRLAGEQLQGDVAQGPHGAEGLADM